MRVTKKVRGTKMRRKNIKIYAAQNHQNNLSSGKSKRKPDLQILTLLKQRGGMVMEEDRYTYPYK